MGTNHRTGFFFTLFHELFLSSILQEIIDNAGHGPLEDADGYKVRHFANVDAKKAEKDGETAELRHLFRASEHSEECFSFSFNLEVSHKVFILTVHFST